MQRFFLSYFNIQICFAAFWLASCTSRSPNPDTNAPKISTTNPSVSTEASLSDSSMGGESLTLPADTSSKENPSNKDPRFYHLDESFRAVDIAAQTYCIEGPHDIKVGKNGYIYVLGRTTIWPRSMCLVRIDDKGQVDKTFSNGVNTFAHSGEIIFDHTSMIGLMGPFVGDGGMSFSGNDQLALSSDSIFILALQAQPGYAARTPGALGHLVVVKLSQIDGTFDKSYGNDAIATIEPVVYRDGFEAGIRALDDGTIVGHANSALDITSDDNPSVVFKLDKSGKPDPSFGTGGIAGPFIVPQWNQGFSIGKVRISSITPVNSNRMLVTVQGNIEGKGWQLASIALNANGSIDTTYGNNGIALAETDSRVGTDQNTIAFATAYSDLNGLIAVGNGELRPTLGIVASWTPDGLPNTRLFSKLGMFSILPPENYTSLSLSKVVIDTDGDIVIAGFASNAPDSMTTHLTSGFSEFVTFNSEGAIKKRFFRDPPEQANFRSFMNGNIQAMTLDENGRIVAVNRPVTFENPFRYKTVVTRYRKCALSISAQDISSSTNYIRYLRSNADCTGIDLSSIGALTYQWSQISGPGPYPASFKDKKSNNTEVALPQVGDYEFMIEVTGKEGTVSDTVKVTRTP